MCLLNLLFGSENTEVEQEYEEFLTQMMLFDDDESEDFDLDED